jgi:hypothetical protein
MSHTRAEKIWGIYWRAVEDGLPLLVNLLATDEVTGDYECKLEAYCAEATV